MNRITRSHELAVPDVTTGPLPASTKVYSCPEGHPDIRVPFRDIALAPSSAETTFRVYDPSGAYTDAAAKIDVDQGLPRLRAPWIAERGGIESYTGRAVRPEDNGNVGAGHLARDFGRVRDFELHVCIGVSLSKLCE